MQPGCETPCLFIRSTLRERRVTGVALAPGIAIGAPHARANPLPLPDRHVKPPLPGRTPTSLFKVEQEIARFRSALDLSRHDVQLIQMQMHRDGVREGAEILDAHLMMLRDPMITDYIEDKVRATQQTLEYIIQGFIEECQRKFSRISDDAFRMRLQDIQDVINRIVGHLNAINEPSVGTPIPEGAILIVREITPSLVAEAERYGSIGFVTFHGGETSHSAIIARARGLPYVSRIDLSSESLDEIGQMIVDGYTGTVILNPSLETLDIYERRAEELQASLLQLERERMLPAVLADGSALSLSANIKLLDELDELNHHPFEGIGLYRSECLIDPNLGALPPEEQQFQAYCQIVRSSKRHGAVIRVFDLGGDKPSGLLVDRNLAFEANPFLGCRGLRLLLRYPEVIQTQLRALWRASLYGRLRVLVPMVTSPAEFLAFREELDRARETLLEEGFLLPQRLELGALIEVPSAAIMAREIAAHADFLSIGTNDLTQYTLAVERGNATLTDLFNSFDPSVLRLIQHVCKEAHLERKPVSVCGELASDPKAAAILLGLGVQELVVSPRALPLLKHAIRTLDPEDSRNFALACCIAPDGEEVRRMATEFIRSRCPTAALLGSGI